MWLSPSGYSWSSYSSVSTAVLHCDEHDVRLSVCLSVTLVKCDHTAAIQSGNGTWQDRLMPKSTRIILCSCDRELCPEDHAVGCGKCQVLQFNGNNVTKQRKPRVRSIWTPIGSCIQTQRIERHHVQAPTIAGSARNTARMSRYLSILLSF